MRPEEHKNMSTATRTSASDWFFPEIDFAIDPLPDFHSRMAELRDSGQRVVPVKYLGETAWIILRHDDVSALYRNEAGVPAGPAYRRHSEPAQGKTLLCMEGDEHRVNRLLVSGAFHPGAIRRSISTLLRPLADELIDGLTGQTGVDLVAAYTHRYPFKVITGLLGIPVADEPELHQWLQGLFQFPWNPELALEARAAITAYLAPIVRQRRADPREDLLSLLATAVVEGKQLSDEEIFSFVRLIFPAGADTTYLSLGSLLWAVLRDDTLRQWRVSPSPPTHPCCTAMPRPIATRRCLQMPTRSSSTGVRTTNRSPLVAGPISASARTSRAPKSRCRWEPCWPACRG